jgi:hypothetical protein
VEQFLSKHAHAVVAGLLRWTSARFDRYPRGVEPQTAGGLPLFSLVSRARISAPDLLGQYQRPTASGGDRNQPNHVLKRKRRALFQPIRYAKITVRTALLATTNPRMTNKLRR